MKVIKIGKEDFLCSIWEVSSFDKITKKRCIFKWNYGLQIPFTKIPWKMINVSTFN
jgi:hypothetical protein